MTKCKLSIFSIQRSLRIRNYKQIITYVLGYPNHPMSFLLKLWWIVQASYWIHCIPELYFQRVKKDEWAGRIRQAAAAFSFVALAYGFK